jgi:glyoxylase-like metal-dependent hydrolase (beta-lactamase superfamily II)
MTALEFLTEPEPSRGHALPVAPGIRRVVAANPGPMTYHGTNTYLLEWPGGVAVVDPGPDDPAHVRHLLEAAGGPVRAILLTHTHRDHVGAAAALREATGAPVHAWHEPADPSLTPDSRLQDGQEVGGWRALHTPGHAADHLCFLRAGGVLLSGDHVMGWSTSVIGPPGGDMTEYFASLERLLAVDASLYLPGHGPPVHGPRPFVSSLLEHRRAREAAIIAVLGPEPAPASAIVAALYPALEASLLRAAERSVTAHLHKLRREGKAAQRDEGWVACV